MTDTDIQTEGKPRVGDGTPGPGRPKGSVNRATERTRKAIAMIAEDLADEFKGWITRTAQDDPKGAADIYLKAIEYHIPKLSRVEAHVTPGGELTHDDWINSLK